MTAPSLGPSLSSSSSIDRPNRNLAQVLFGQDDDSTDTESPSQGIAVTHDEPNASVAVPATSASLDATQGIALMDHGWQASAGGAGVVRTPTNASMTLQRNPSLARLPPQTIQEHAALELEVQQKVQAATMALRKPASREGLSHSTSISRKRIDTSQISKPLLVSSSTSVDTIPLKSPPLVVSNASGPSKIGSRFKRLRGSLRAKAAPVEEAAQSAEQSVTQPSQTAGHDTEKARSLGLSRSGSTTDVGKTKVAAPSPPTSAGPGLKGFMARFRAKRATEIPQSSSSSISSDQHSPHLSSAPLSPLAHRQFSSSSTHSGGHSQSPTSDSGYTTTTPRPDHYRQASNALSTAAPQVQPHGAETTEGGGNDAISQLFAAATNLGIDQGAINELLKRSGSLNSRTLLGTAQETQASHNPPSSQVSQPGQHLTVPPIQQPNLSSSSGSDYTATPGMFNSSPVSDLSIAHNLTNKEEPALPEEPTTAKPGPKRPDHLRQAKIENSDTNPVVRRTIFFADPRQSTAEGAPTRKSTMRRRRASAQSASNRSIHDRVPTPPPSKTPQGKRFSHEASPPVPQIPHGHGSFENSQLSVPTSHSEKSRSAAYDSL